MTDAPKPLGWVPTKPQKRSSALAEYWKDYNRRQCFRLVELEGGSCGRTTFVDSYEELASVTKLSITTLRQRFAAGGGSFERAVNGVLTQITRGMRTGDANHD